MCSEFQRDPTQLVDAISLDGQLEFLELEIMHISIGLHVALLQGRNSSPISAWSLTGRSGPLVRQYLHKVSALQYELMQFHITSSARLVDLVTLSIHFAETPYNFTYRQPRTASQF